MERTEPYVELRRCTKKICSTEASALHVRLRHLGHRHDSDQLSLASSGDKDPSDTLVTPGTDDREVPPPWSSTISDGARRSKVTVSTLRMNAPANPITPSVARQRISRPVILGNLQYLTTNPQMPPPIPSRSTQLPTRLQRYSHNLNTIVRATSPMSTSSLNAR
ncbi:hypothetical protein EDB92DRAFT_1420161 [Lactarius akahatsu]|uniref:Uncharacterized protein n=1 Tax=Lactarius akahatsu TaxID=416441 RepID=A0AAD4LRD4_9AGAM|nr:hypothetical protein EDB92DRAFT_1420161 [Lactarius akahatsu]